MSVSYSAPRLRLSLPLLLLFVVASLLCARPSVGAPADACDSVPPLVAPVRVALLTHCNGPTGELLMNPADPRSGCGMDKMDDVRQQLLSYDLALHMYTEGMRRVQPLPLSDGSLAAFRYTYINLGNLDTLGLMMKLDSVLRPLGNSTHGLVHDVLTSTEYGGPFSFVVLPTSAPDQLIAHVADVCERDNTCIAISTTGGVHRDVHVCMEPLPADCVARARTPGMRRFHNLLGVQYDSTNVASSALEAFRSMGITRISILAENTPVMRAALTRTQQIARQLNMKVMHADLVVPCDPRLGNCPLMPDGTPGLARAQTHILNGTTPMEYVRRLQADGVEASILLATVLSGSLRTKAQVIEAMRDADWIPRAMLLAGGGETSLSTFMAEPNEAAYGFSTSQWNPHLTGADYQNYQGANGHELLPAVGDHDAPAVFADTFKPFLKQLGLDVYWKGDSPMAVWSVVGFQALYITQKLVEIALTADVRSLAQASSRLSTPSVFHLLQFDATGRTVRVNDVLMQYQPESGSGSKLQHVVIAPYNIGEEAVFPMPTWKERVFEPVQYDEPLEKVMIAINALCIAACILLAALVMRHRQHAVIRSATPSFCLLTILGAVLMLLSNIFHTRVESDTHCAAQVWLLSFGFTMLFSSLFVKTFRIWRIFDSTKKLVVVKMKNRDLLLAVAAFLLTDLLINAVWTGVTGMHARVVVRDVHRPSLNEVSCDYRDSMAYLAAHLGVKGALLLFGMTLTYLVRNTPSQFNESTYIGVCIYNVSVIVCFIVPILASGMAGREQYLLRAFALMVIALSTVSILYIPKFFNIHKLNNSRGGNTLVNTPTDGHASPVNSGVGGVGGVGGRTSGGGVAQSFGGGLVNVKSAAVAGRASVMSMSVEREKRYASMTPDRPLPLLSTLNSTAVDGAGTTTTTAATSPVAGAIAGRSRATMTRHSQGSLQVVGELANGMGGSDALSPSARSSSRLSNPPGGGRIFPAAAVAVAVPAITACSSPASPSQADERITHSLPGTIEMASADAE